MAFIEQMSNHVHSSSLKEAVSVDECLADDFFRKYSVSTFLRAEVHKSDHLLQEEDYHFFHEDALINDRNSNPAPCLISTAGKILEQSCSFPDGGVVTSPKARNNKMERARHNCCRRQLSEEERREIRREQVIF